MWLWLVSNALAAEPVLRPYDTGILDRLTSFVGIFILVGIAWLMSENRRKVDWKLVGWGVGLQLLFGLVIMSPVVSGVFYVVVNGGVDKLLSFAGDGANFVFQPVQPHMVEAVDATGEMTNQFYVGTVNGMSPPLKTFAFWILPTIIFFSALMSALYHLGVMQFLVKGIAWVMVRTLGTSGAESLSAAGNIFVGQTEAPLLIRPFVGTMTRSELMAVMTGGFATVAGGVLGAYVGFFSDGQGGYIIPNLPGHLVVASIISAPAALAIAKVMVPEMGVPATRGKVEMPADVRRSNVMEAIASGASEGMKLALNVAAMLIAIIALVSMFDWFIGLAPITFCDSGVVFGMAGTCGVDAAGEAVMGEPLSMSLLLGWLFAPIAFIMGVPWDECIPVGRLLGEKVVLTEIIAYLNLAGLMTAENPVLSERGAVIASYALCGFANFGSIGIQIAGIGGIAENKLPELASLGFRAMTAGVIAACMTGAVAGVML
ncbi:MAG: CNT family concentrative nucleoside transporter [Myxococcota bacterium]|jgi:CNT family concentrative nucleoside transporter